jgi:tetratricopeptide (TPR) repeat protein
MLIWGAYELKLKKPFNKRLLCIFAVFVILLFTAISAKHVNCWRNTETVFQHAIAAEPDNPALYQAFGDILTFKNEKAKAIQIFSRAIQNGLETFGIYYRLGVLFYEQGKPVKAIENYNKALHIEPDARVHNDIAVALADIQQFDKAIDHLHKSLALNPDYVLAKQNLKRLVNRTGRNKKCQVNTQNGATSGDDHIEEDKKNGCATFIQ